jgi:hypothetical protein
LEKNQSNCITVGKNTIQLVDVENNLYVTRLVVTVGLKNQYDEETFGRRIVNS